jgi:four helix bundle protein
MAESIIGLKSFDFAKEIIELYKLLYSGNEYVISKQLLRSGTSIGANVQEALAGQSKKDFIHKLSIALKEARETRYWLLFLKETTITDIDIKPYLDKLEELIKILSSIILTSKNNS